ncbi:MAG: hypothetical protein WBA42_01370 [Mesorhizobium sp.]
MTEQTPAPQQPATLQVHPLAALSEASFDNEVHRNRRLMLANNIHTLTQMVADRDQQIADLKQRLATYEPPEAEPKKEGE